MRESRWPQRHLAPFHELAIHQFGYHIQSLTFCVLITHQKEAHVKWGQKVIQSLQ